MSYRGGCAEGMPMKGACHSACLHRASVLAYRDARDAWEALWETNHQLELGEFRETYPPPTFRDWLIATAGSNQERHT